MIKVIEKILVKLSGNTKGYNFNVWDWDSESLVEKSRKKPWELTDSEKYALAFFEEIGEVLNIWQPIKKWQKPTGDILNEHRNLH